LKNNVIIIILLLFLAVTSFFWFQSLQIRDLPPAKRPAAPAVSGKEAEAFIKLAEELLISYRDPLPQIYGRDPFFGGKPVKQTEVVEIDPTTIFTVSSIIYSDLHSLVVVDGEILAEGDSMYDHASGSEYMIENIAVDKIEITDGKKKYTLEKAHEASGER